ncbi:MAG: (E)-4-hydroxy-3-methylbut-2-enyl-diphosphate synthase [Proteobacteria bacterium]|nr:(E)-4-hydroxy-3-methylbut-2-enyl-diphosphate synthase [Pseudomonadota bacterium]
MSLLEIDPFRPIRRRTRVVRIGDIEVGGSNPIRIQSMTTTDTMDTLATVEQVTRLAEVGCEIVRLTAPSIRDAENLGEIRRLLQERKVEVPLVADIHFTPNAALIAADIVDKVRINPGNYADRKKFEIREYDDAQYAAEVERVADRFRPLVLRCKGNGVAMRIGTNHGSLSDRIMNRFGDTAQGMVESAMEFLDVCEAENYNDIIFSMKASNTQVAIAAYRLLAQRLEERSPGEASYPFHVGVTEAGAGEDGRIKSAIGIGSLLEDGLGDTIRVSLTEDPVREVPVARMIAARAGRGTKEELPSIPVQEVEVSPFDLSVDRRRRATAGMSWDGLSIGGDAPVRVELELEEGLDRPSELAAQLAMDLSMLGDIDCESLLVSLDAVGAFARVGQLQKELASLGHDFPISVRVGISDEGILGSAAAASAVGVGRWVGRIDSATEPDQIVGFADSARTAGAAIEWEIDAQDHEIPGLVRLVLANLGADQSDCAMSLASFLPLHSVRVLASALGDGDVETMPIVLRQRVDLKLDSGTTDEESGSSSDSALIDGSIRLGSLLCDGIGDAVSIQAQMPAAPAIDLAYRILQGARQRTTRTEYISCPSCGRTLFDLEETTAKIQARTDHLSGLKIAVMGCIVNGPGEMADADFGYVGSGVGQITLYVGKQVVARAVPEAEAPDRLVDLIRENGRWVEEESDGAS